MSPNNSSPSLLDDITRLIDDRCDWGSDIVGYQSVDSTNTAARSWAAGGAPEGGVVIAEYQTSGKGRLGRRWEAASGRNLLFSIVLRPNLADDRRGLITLASSVAVAEILEPITSPYVPEIKWPNDIIIDERKCCGMLLETVPSSNNESPAQGVILGIGLNVNQVTFSRSLENKATSLRLVTGQLIERAPLFVQLVQSIRRWYKRLLDDEAEAVCTAFEERMLFTGENVTLRYADDDSSIEGVIDGIDDTGGLRLLQAGRPRTFHAGEVTFS